MHPLDAVFSPKAVAVAGASADPMKAGHVIFRNFIESGFKGKAFPVNPNAPDILGHKCYKSVRDIPYPLDLVVVATPPETVPKILEECIKAKVRSVVVISPATNLRRFASSLVLVGPNGLGVYDPLTATDTIFLPRTKLERPGKGAVMVATQSGALGAWLLDKAAQKGYGLSHFLSYGNAAGVGPAEIVDYAASDERTKSLVLHLEGVNDGRRLFDAIRRCPKPILLVKSAATPAGVAAASAHTGAPATGEAFSQVMVQAGALFSPDLDTALDSARILATFRPSGPRVQLITGAGGMGVLLADALSTAGLTLAQPSKETQKQFHQVCPHLAGSNPVDTGGNTTASVYHSLLEAAATDPNVDMVIVSPVVQVPGVDGDIVSALSTIPKHKPVVVMVGGGRYAETIKKSYEAAGLLTTDTITGTAQGLAALWNRRPLSAPALPQKEQKSSLQKEQKLQQKPPQKSAPPKKTRHKNWPKKSKHRVSRSGRR